MIIINKIDGEFVVVELEDGNKYVCPREIFPENIKVGDKVKVTIEKIEESV